MNRLKSIPEKAAIIFQRPLFRRWGEERDQGGTSPQRWRLANILTESHGERFSSAFLLRNESVPQVLRPKSVYAIYAWKWPLFVHHQVGEFVSRVALPLN